MLILHESEFKLLHIVHYLSRFAAALLVIQYNP